MKVAMKSAIITDPPVARRVACIANFFNSATATLTITALLYGFIIAHRLAIHHFDASFFLTAGSAFCRFGQVPPDLTVDTPQGYDGQFYYRLALDPFTNQRTRHGITIDNPPYRQQRILYPALAGVLAFGHVKWLPWTMILVNYLAVCVLGFTAGLFAQAFGRHALWGLVIPFYPGILLSLDRDLTEVLAISFALGALYFLHRGCIILGACTLALAILARETIVILACALFAEWVWQMLRRQARWIGAVLTIPLAAFAAWQLWIFATWGRFGPAKGPIGTPMKYFTVFLNQATRSMPERSLLFWELTLLVGTTLLAASALFGSGLDRGVKLAWIGYLVLTLLLSGAVWVEDWAFMRATVELMVLSSLILMNSRKLTPIYLIFASNLGLSILLAYAR